MVNSNQLSLRIIPCLDVADGQIVKGVNFAELKTVGDPVARAEFYYRGGADEITFLDVNASIESRSTTLELVQKTAEQIFVPLTVGGGVSSVEIVADLLSAGADKVGVNSAAIRRPELIAEIADRFGNQVTVLSLDLKRGKSESGFIVTTHGGRVETDLDALAWITKATELGIGELLVNSIDADGTKSGFDLELMRLVKSVAKVPVIASGGAGQIADFIEVAETGVDAILAASVFHYDQFTISEVKSALADSGYLVR